MAENPRRSLRDTLGPLQEAADRAAGIQRPQLPGAGLRAGMEALDEVEPVLGVVTERGGNRFLGWLKQAGLNYLDRFDPRGKDLRFYGLGLAGGFGSVLAVTEFGATFGIAPMLRGFAVMAVLQASGYLFNKLHQFNLSRELRAYENDSFMNVFTSEDDRKKLLSEIIAFEKEMAAQKLTREQIWDKYDNSQEFENLILPYLANPSIIGPERLASRLAYLGEKYVAVDGCAKSLAAGLAAGSVYAGLGRPTLTAFYNKFTTGEFSLTPPPTTPALVSADQTPSPTQAVVTAQETPTPFNTPTMEPTKTPAVPTSQPTLEPSKTPTSTPTARPTLEPTKTPVPSTPTPEATKTSVPATPTMEPSKTPVATPTTSPSVPRPAVPPPSAPDLSTRPDIARLVNSPEFIQQKAAGVGALLPEVNKLVDQVVDPSASETARGRAKMAVLRFIEGKANQVYDSVVSGMGLPGIGDEANKKGLENLTAYVNSSNAMNDISREVRTAFTSEQVLDRNVFEAVTNAVGANPENAREVTVKAGSTLGEVLNLEWNPVKDAEKLGSFLSLNRPALVSAWLENAPGVPYPLSEFEIRNLVELAKKGDVEAYKRLVKAGYWIRAGQVVKVATEKGIKLALDAKNFTQ